MNSSKAARGNVSEPVNPMLFHADSPSEHYLQSLSAVGETQDIVAREDIYTAKGIRLIARGTRINRGTLHHLRQHRLATPLDLAFAASDAIDAAMLMRDIEACAGSAPLLHDMLSRPDQAPGLGALVADTELPAGFAFRLTIMRGDRRPLYLHSLRVAIAAHCLGMRLKLPWQRLQHLLLASLGHELGEMHAGPAMLEPGSAMGSEEGRHLPMHPIASCMIMQQMSTFPEETMQAVLQHHERLDGSGYPHARKGAEIGILARLIAVAETLDAIAHRLGQDRLGVVFCLNQNRLDARAVAALLDILPARTRNFSG